MSDKLFGMPIVIDPTMPPDEFRLVAPGHFVQTVPVGVPPMELTMAKVEQRPIPDTITYAARLKLNGSIKWVAD